MLSQIKQSERGGCCHGGVLRAAPPSRRGWEYVAGALSLGAWVIMPKCPLCLAAHVALWTGLGLSLTQAAYLRWLLLFLSGLVLLCLVFKRRVQALAGTLIVRDI